MLGRVSGKHSVGLFEARLESWLSRTWVVAGDDMHNHHLSIDVLMKSARQADTTPLTVVPEGSLTCLRGSVRGYPGDVPPQPCPELGRGQ